MLAKVREYAEHALTIPIPETKKKWHLGFNAACANIRAILTARGDDD